jgi:hypothetical protein
MKKLRPALSGADNVHVVDPDTFIVTSVAGTNEFPADVGHQTRETSPVNSESPDHCFNDDSDANFGPFSPMALNTDDLPPPPAQREMAVMAVETLSQLSAQFNAPLGSASVATVAQVQSGAEQNVGASPMASLEQVVAEPVADGRAALSEHSEYDARLVRPFSPLRLVLGDNATRVHMIAKDVYASRFTNGVTIFSMPNPSAVVTVDSVRTLLTAGCHPPVDKATTNGMRCHGLALSNGI